MNDEARKHKKEREKDVDSNKMKNPEYQNEMKLEILVDVKTSIGDFKVGDLGSFSIGEGQYLLNKKYAKKIGDEIP